MSDEAAIARRHVERLADTDPERFEQVMADALSGCQNVLDEEVYEALDVKVEDGGEGHEDQVLVTLPSGKAMYVEVADIEKMLSVNLPYEAWAAIIALMPQKLKGEGW